MIHDINFHKITFVDRYKIFIMPKHVFHNLFYATIYNVQHEGND
jgi:hypothetical protein